MTLDIDRITHPLRLARGSHQPGSGKGCAMNVISYINGDTKITDFPECSAPPLARIVQSLNDHLAGSDGFLSPHNSVIVLDLGWQTMGTADTPREVVWRWLHDLLVDPEHGVVRHACLDGSVAIRAVAALCMRKSQGERVSATEWRAARDAAYAYAAACAGACAVAAAYAAACAGAAGYAAVCAGAAADADGYAGAAGYADVSAGAAADAAASAGAAADADGAAFAAARIDFTRWTIQRWRELARLDNSTAIDSLAIDSALARF